MRCRLFAAAVLLCAAAALVDVEAVPAADGLVPEDHKAAVEQAEQADFQKEKARILKAAQKKKSDDAMQKLKKEEDEQNEKFDKAEEARKIAQLHSDLEWKLKKQKLRMSNKARLQLGEAKINAAAAISKVKQALRRSQIRNRGAFKLQFLKMKLTAERKDKAAARKLKEESQTAEDLAIEKAKQSVAEQIGWSREKAHKMVATIEVRGEKRRLVSEESYNKQMRKLDQDSTAKRVRRLERHTARGVRQNTVQVTRAMRKSFRAERQRLHKMKKLVVAGIKGAQKDATKVVEENAVRLGVKYDPAPLFKINPHVEDLDDNHLFKHTKLPPTGTPSHGKS